MNITRETKPNTDYRFKLLYAIGMIVIVAGHCEGGGISLAHEFFPHNAFEIGLFAFCSGYFYNSMYETEPAQYILKKAKRLLIPLYIWNFVYAGVILILSNFGFTIGEKPTLYNLLVAPLSNGHQFAYNLAGWFVFPLFCIEVFNTLFRKFLSPVFKEKKEHVFFALYLLIGIAGVYMAMQELNTGIFLVLTRIMYLLAFYGLGIYYRQILESHDTLPSRYYFSIVIALELIIIYIYKKAPGYVPSWSLYADDPFIPFIAGFLAVAFWLRVARILEPVIGKSLWVNAIADNTYSIMINQFAGFMLVKAVFAALKSFTPLCSEFSIELFKSDLLYFFVPNGLNQFKIIYLIAGLVVPILIQRCLERIRRLI